MIDSLFNHDNPKYKKRRKTETSDCESVQLSVFQNFFKLDKSNFCAIPTSSYIYFPKPKFLIILIRKNKNYGK